MGKSLDKKDIVLDLIGLANGFVQRPKDLNERSTLEHAGLDSLDVSQYSLDVMDAYEEWGLIDLEEGMGKHSDLLWYLDVTFGQMADYIIKEASRQEHRS